jgi:hypothetical protein
MPNKITIMPGSEAFDFETEHHLDPETIQILHDVLSTRNIIHWDPRDIDNFFKIPGSIMTGSFTMPLQKNLTNLPTLLTSGYIEKLKQIIVCVYHSGYPDIEQMGLVMKSIGELSLLPEDIVILHGDICNAEENDGNTVVKLIAICQD